MVKSVVKEWVAERCTLKQQTVLLSALRGCDGISKEDISKKLTRALRYEMLVSAHGVPTPGTFMHNDVTAETVKQFLSDIDKYPIHWLMHFAHACEIVGYKHPDQLISKWWLTFYIHLCDALHVNPESERQLDKRLQDYT